MKSRGTFSHAEGVHTQAQRIVKKTFSTIKKDKDHIVQPLRSWGGNQTAGNKGSTSDNRFRVKSVKEMKRTRR